MKYTHLLFVLLLLLSSNNKTINKNKTSLLKEKILSIKTINMSKTVTKNFILGKFDYKKNDNFKKLKPIHSSKIIFLDKEVYKSFINMYDDAKRDKIDLKVISGTRNFYEQKIIWERKWNKYEDLKPYKRAKKILEFSSMPATSRHHWGTDLDINNLNNSYFEKGKGKKEYDWLVANANKYGFYQVYTSKEQGRTGYNMEKWHWSYLPLASKYLVYYNENITYKDIVGFKGEALAKETNIIIEFVNGISIKAKTYKDE